MIKIILLLGKLSAVSSFNLQRISHNPCVATQSIIPCWHSIHFILQETFETVRLITKQYKGQKWKQN